MKSKHHSCHKANPRFGIHGFTLIELLIVVAIVAILAALIFPALARARARGHQAACTSNLRQIGAAFESYTTDWDGVFPPHQADASKGDGEGTWDRRIRAYIGSDRVYICPANAEAVFSYACNAWIAQPERYAGPYRSRPVEFRARELADLPNPSETILLFDVPNIDMEMRGMIGERDVQGETLEQVLTGSLPGDRDLVETWKLEYLRAKGEAIPDWVWPRHFRGNLFGFADGRVKWFLRLDKEYGLPSS